MNSISINDIKPGNVFTEDSYVLEDLFFMPKNLPVHDYHLKLLREWKIKEIFTTGTISSQGMSKIIKEKQNIKNVIDGAFNNDASKIIKEKLNIKNNDTLLNIESQNINREALLDSGVKSFVEIYKSWIKTIQKIFNDVMINDVNKEMVKNFILDIIKAINKNRNNALMLFGRKFGNIYYVYNQTIETIILAYIIGDGLNLTQLSLSNLTIATLFHDVGMVKIPKPIIEKKEKLTQQEIEIIQNHTNIGYKYLRSAGYSAIIASGALQHHERIDGKGYPNGLLPDKVTGIAKIISIVDAYCAAIASKPFKESPQHAKEAIQDLLRQGGTAYDPSILKELIKNISFYPIGSLILLSNDVPAQVVGTSGVAMKPIIKELNESEKVIDLSKTNDVYIKGLYQKKDQ
jgi:HD-GYP domain-containing protein (c-di-GMP phosphodiesterase class II)